MNLIISHTNTRMTKDPRDHAVATSEDIARAKAAAAAERVRAIEQVPELRRYFISAHPLRPSRVALDTRAACHDALDPVIEEFGLSLVLLAPVLLGVGALSAVYGEAEQVPGHDAARTRAARDAMPAFEGVALAAARSPSLLSRLGRLLDLCSPLPLAGLVLLSAAMSCSPISSWSTAGTGSCHSCGSATHEPR